MSKINYILLFSLSFITFLFAGCGQGYKKISFCWTSDQRLNPEDRVASLDFPIDQVTNTIIEWVEKEKRGEVITHDKDAKKKITIAVDADEKYVLAREIAEKAWNAYNSNTYRKWEDGEWESFKNLMKEQIQIKDANDKCCYIKAKLEKRQATTSYRVQTGTRMTQMYNPGFTAYSPSGGGIKKTTVSGYMMSTPTPIYETRTKTKDFYSLMEIYIYKDSGMVSIYAKASPLDDDTSVVADYGCSIGSSYWKYVTGKEEAKLVQDLLSYLKERNKKIGNILAP